MLRHSVTTSILRFYENENPSDFEDYIAVCYLVWETNDIVWIQGFHGDLTRKHLRLLLNFFVENNIKLVRAKRSPFRTLPLSRNMGSHHEIFVQDLIDRFIKNH